MKGKLGLSSLKSQARQILSWKQFFLKSRLKRIKVTQSWTHTEDAAFAPCSQGWLYPKRKKMNIKNDHILI